MIVCKYQNQQFIIKNLFVMFSSRKSNLSNADMGTGETLFDFLKRKKRVSLEDSVVKSRKIPSSDLSISHIEAKQQQYEDNQTARNGQTSKRFSSTNVTPKKVTFVDTDNKKQTARTFIDMISPMKPRGSQNYEKSAFNQEEQSRELKSKSKKSEQKLFTRKQLNNSIRVLKQTLHNLIKVGKSLKQKSHSLFIQLRPVLKFAEETENKTIKKKIQQSKQKLRVMEHQFSQLQIDNANEIIQTFHKTLSQHLLSLQAKNRSQFEKSQMDSINRIRTEKDNKISQLLSQNQKYEQTINIMEKKINKLQKQLNQGNQKQQQRLSLHQENSEIKISKLQQKIAQANQTNVQLLERIGQLQQEKIEKDKRLKDALYAKEVTERRLIEENSNAKAAREEFLLNQIMILKQQFQNDMKQLTTLYACKEQDLNAIIQQQRKQLKGLKDYCEFNKENEKKINMDSQTMKNLISKCKKQNECLVTDMHRMNEQLYQHWLALKDIKTLASRLHIFPKFSRIYQDLPFNDLLFS